MKLRNDLIPTIDMSGRGGAEKVFGPILEDFHRVSKPLWDFESTEEKVELKKQKNLQWFDIGKYHNLTKQEKQIVMMVVVHDGSNILSIDTINLQNLLELACKDQECQRKGWTYQNIQQCHLMKTNFRPMQVKVPLNVKHFIAKYRKSFQNVYLREVE